MPSFKEANQVRLSTRNYKTKFTKLNYKTKYFNIFIYFNSSTLALTNWAFA